MSRQFCSLQKQHENDPANQTFKKGRGRDEMLIGMISRQASLGCVCVRTRASEAGGRRQEPEPVRGSAQYLLNYNVVQRRFLASPPKTPGGPRVRPQHVTNQ